MINGTALASFQTLDYLGRVIEQGDLNGVLSGSLDLETYSAGVYFLRAVTQENQTVVVRFVKR